MQKILLLTLVIACTLCLPSCAPYLRKQVYENRQERRGDIREHRQDMQQDRQEYRQDRWSNS